MCNWRCTTCELFPLKVAGFEVTLRGWFWVTPDKIESSKVRIKARRLVPLPEALKARLQPYRRDLGPINVYADPQAALKRIAAEEGIELKANGFRHSYISYRLAAINDTARVALEAGNSPEVIFQHYRELVTPDDAAQWFSVVLP